MSPACPVPNCKIPVDIILRSSDGVLLGAHKANLDQFSEGFPPVEIIAASNIENNEIVDLTESLETLQLLLKFMHKHPYPDVSKLPEKALFALAYAAEKYIVHSAMALCRAVISFRIHEVPISALRYGVKFGYTDIADAAAPLLCHTPIAEMKRHLTDGDSMAYTAWLEFKVTTAEPLMETQLIPDRNTYTRSGGASDKSKVCLQWIQFHDALQAALPRYRENLLDAAMQGMPATVEALEEAWEKAPDCSRLGERCLCYTLYENLKRVVGALAGRPSFRSFLVS